MFDEKLIGVDINHTINAYYNRDIKYDINNINTIIEHLQKLGYWNFSFTNEKEKFVRNKLIDFVKNTHYNNLNNNLYNVINEIETSDDFISFHNNLLKRQTRSTQITDFMSNSVSNINTLDFYNMLTLDELIYIGY
jgi:hypothetical protein